MNAPAFGAKQRGGFAVGMIVGLLIGLALALGVALYVTKVPVPFVNKVPQRTADQDAAEAEKNKNWDPNGPLYGKNPARPMGTASGLVATPESSTAPPKAVASQRDPAVILGDKPAPPPTTTNAATAPKTANGVATNPGTSAGADPFTYFVQAGAYAMAKDAEQQRAKLAIIGMESKLTEREQSGRTVYRVRVGPFDKKDDADATKDRLAAAGVEAALVRVQR